MKLYADSSGLPIIPSDRWAEMNQNYTKQDIKDALAEYIITHKPKFPFRKIEEKDVVDKFKKFCGDDLGRMLMTNLQSRDVLEKYDDYKYPFDQHGFGMIQFGHHYNDVSNFFQQENRLACSSYGFPASLEIWKDPVYLKKMNYTFWRLGNTDIGLDNWRESFRLGAYVATQFKPHVAKCIYQMTNANTVLDTSCGWGDRLVAFYASNAIEFFGCDPNENVYEMYKQQCLWYEEQLGHKAELTDYGGYFICKGKKRVQIFRSPAEDVQWNNWTSGIDCTFTSPPYFSTELYNKGGENEKDQSWSRYTEYEKWRDGFFFPMLRGAWKVTNKKGFVFINIMDPVIKGKRYRTCDELVDFMKDDLKANFLGQLGMRIKQRPKKMESGLNEFFKKDFIENIWCFGKSNGILQLNGSLESVMGDDNELFE